MATVVDELVRQKELAKEQARKAIEEFQRQKRSIDQQISSLQSQSRQIDTEIGKLRAVAG